MVRPSVLFGGNGGPIINGLGSVPGTDVGMWCAGRSRHLEQMSVSLLRFKERLNKGLAHGEME